MNASLPLCAAFLCVLAQLIFKGMEWYSEKETVAGAVKGDVSTCICKESREEKDEWMSKHVRPFPSPFHPSLRLGQTLKG